MPHTPNSTDMPDIDSILYQQINDMEAEIHRLIVENEQLQAALDTARAEAVRIANEVTLDAAKGFAGVPKSMKFTCEDVAKLCGAIAGDIEKRIRSLSTKEKGEA
jgi:hypothetical protein